MKIRGCDTTSGACNVTDWVIRLIRGVIQMNLCPEAGRSIDITPVDFVSKAIIQLSLKEQCYGRAFHIINPKGAIPISEIWDGILESGYNVKLVPFSQWYSKLEDIAKQQNQESILQPLLPYFKHGFPTSGKFDNSQTMGMLKDLSFPKITKEHVKLILNYLVEIGLLSKPS